MIWAPQLAAAEAGGACLAETGGAEAGLNCQGLVINLLQVHNPSSMTCNMFTEVPCIR